MLKAGASIIIFSGGGGLKVKNILVILGASFARSAKNFFHLVDFCFVGIESEKNIEFFSGDYFARSANIFFYLDQKWPKNVKLEQNYAIGV